MRWLPKLPTVCAKHVGRAALLLSAVLVLKAQVASINEYPFPPGYPTAGFITAGPDGALWFTEYSPAGRIGRITPTGVFSDYPTITNFNPMGIAAGPDGALWITLYNFTNGSVRIAHLTTAGMLTEYSFPADTCCLGAITAGPDGNLWFTETGSDTSHNKIGRITTAGVITSYPVPSGSAALRITAGPDGAVWFTEYGGRIGRITSTGVITEYPTPTLNTALDGITAGPDGALWFTESNPNRVGRMTTAGVFTESSVPSGSPGPIEITAGPDGALWFTEWDPRQIGRITTGGVITEYPIPAGQYGPYSITSGPDGALWFTMSGSIGQVVLTPPKPPSVSCTASSNILWPPNGKSVLITVSGTISAGSSLLSPDGAGYRVSDEYGQVEPGGSITIGPGGSYSFAVSLIAARDGNDRDGRAYTIVVNSEDTAGEVGSCSAIVIVPHDQGD